MIGEPHVELGMYPFASVEWAWDVLWAAVHERAPWTPPKLTRSGDVHARWYDTDCVVTQVCGWPFAALHRNDMHLVGSFTLDIDDADDAGHYRAVLLSPHEATLDELVAPGTHAVANSADSLSGWISLQAATVGAGRRWPGRVSFTSAHVDSVRALARREADLACIDAWTLAFIDGEQPELLQGLRRVGAGPPIPTPALTARRTVADADRRQLEEAFRAAVDDPATASARAALHIAGTAGNTLADYLATLELGASPGS